MNRVKEVGYFRCRTQHVQRLVEGGSIVLGRQKGSQCGVAVPERISKLSIKVGEPELD